MDAVCQRIMDGLHDIFPEAEGIGLTPEFELGKLPDWDSMAAVNLQTYLQDQFGIELPLEILAENTRIIEIAGFIVHPLRVDDA